MSNKLKLSCQNFFVPITLVTTCLSLSLPLISHANDTSYDEQNRTIVFEKNDDISMESAVHITHHYKPSISTGIYLSSIAEIKGLETYSTNDNTSKESFIKLC